MKKLRWLLILVIFIAGVFTHGELVQGQERLILATTTSTENSGLLNELLPGFEEKFNVRVDVIAVGTGKAIKLAENGDVDLILVHARGAEDAFVAAGYGVNRRDVMYNDFVILGPKLDPAGIKGLTDASVALQQIATSQVTWISRGDESGTHKKELQLWKKAGLEPEGSWYFEVGQGMGASLTIANEKDAYILTDQGTYLAYKGELQLDILLKGDPELFNPYGVIPVNPARYPHVNYQLAMAFVGYLTSQEGQQIIQKYQKFGEQLFYPLAIPES